MKRKTQRILKIFQSGLFVAFGSLGIYGGYSYLGLLNTWQSSVIGAGIISSGIWSFVWGMVDVVKLIFFKGGK